jgi:drug/metabolite transporter (DMT)-like permease
MKLSRGEPIAPTLLLAIGILAVSTASIFIRYAQTEAPSLVIAAYRLSVASLVVAPIGCVFRRFELRTLRAAEWGWMLLSGVFLALHFATWVSSLEYTTVASSVVLVATSPLWVALAGWALLHERLTRTVIGGLVVAMIGVLVVSLSDAAQQAGSAPLLGNALALAGALMVAGYWLIGRKIRARLSLVPYVAVVYSLGAITLLVVTLSAQEALTGYTPIVFVWFVLLGLVPQLVGHSSFNWALARLPATSVAVATLGEPIGSTVLAYLLLDEAVTPLKALGAALILTGIVLCVRGQASAR